MTEKLTAQQAGRKGAALRAAKKLAAETGNPVDVPQYGAKVHPDGTRENYTPVGEAAKVGIGRLVERLNEPPEPPRPSHSTLGGEEDDQGDIPWGGEEEPDLREVEEIRAAIMLAEEDEPARNPPPTTMLGWANHYVDMGLDEADAMVLAQTKMGPATPPATLKPTLPPTELPMHAEPVRGPQQPRSAGEGEELGPDPQMIADYEEKMKDYVEPVLLGRITVEIDDKTWTTETPVRFLDYLLRKSAWETSKRRREMDPADCLQWLLRQAKALDQEAMMLMHPSSATGPQGTFNANAGGWS